MNTERTPEHSKAVREVLGKPPSKAVRMGATIVALGFILLLSLTALVDYPDVIKAPLTLTGRRPPARLLARYTGEVDTLFVVPGQRVMPGNLVAELRNPARLEDILLVESVLENYRKGKLDAFQGFVREGPKGLQLGDVQGAYLGFREALLALVLKDSLSTLPQQLGTLSSQLREHRQLLGQQQRQIDHFGKELTLIQTQHGRNLSLKDKGVFSMAEFEQSAQVLSQGRQRLEELKTFHTRTKIAIAQLEGRILEMELREAESEGIQEEAFVQHLGLLETALSDFEQKYVLRSPISGTVNFTGVWESFQMVEEGETLFVVLPEGKQPLLGLLQVPPANLGKVREGQEVRIRLSHYPHAQFGYLKGTVSRIGRVPQDPEQTYAVHVNVVDGKTSLGKVIPVKGELLGQAEIITEKISLLQRILFGLRELWTPGGRGDGSNR